MKTIYSKNKYIKDGTLWYWVTPTKLISLPIDAELGAEHRE